LDFRSERRIWSGFEYAMGFARGFALKRRLVRLPKLADRDQLVFGDLDSGLALGEAFVNLARAPLWVLSISVGVIRAPGTDSGIGKTGQEPSSWFRVPAS
jgi:hypothetical protein